MTLILTGDQCANYNWHQSNFHLNLFGDNPVNFLPHWYTNLNSQHKMGKHILMLETLFHVINTNCILHKMIQQRNNCHFMVNIYVNHPWRYWNISFIGVHLVLCYWMWEALVNGFTFITVRRSIW